MTKSKKSRFLAVAGVLGFGLFGIQTGTSVAGMTGITPIKLSAENAKKAFYSDYGTEADCLANGVEVTKEIANEGMVLLKNDGTLPLDGVKNITIFGKNSVKPCIGGGGSGGSKGVMDTIDVYESLTDAGYNCNPKMKAFYEDATRSGTGRHTGGGFGAPIDVGETRLSSYDSATKATFAGYSDAAVIFITRTGAEGADEPLYEVVDDSQGSEGFAKDVTGTENYPKDAHYLELSHNEKDMINLVETSGFKKIILVANSCNAMELDSLVKDTKINGIIWTNGPGGTGFSALGKIMNGEVNPSGKTVDAFAKDFTKDPAFQNISTNAQTQADHKENYTLAPADTATDAQKKMFEGATINKFTEYEEGIYIGYKYYETKGEVEGEEWYNDNVVFPFGYGLSYTSFSKNISAIRIDGVSNTNSSIAITSASKKVEIDVTVKNTGEVAGKEVVQIYGNPEYIEGGIEKASANLLAFGKSKLLAPGESETVTVSYNVQDMGSYDYNDANKNGHMGYELEGTTVVTLKDDSHKVAVGEHNTINFTTASVIDYDTDGNTSNKVVNQFSAKVSKPDGTASTIDNPYRSLPIESDGLDFTSMTRKAVGGERMILPSAPAGVATTIGTNSVLAVKLSQTATDFSCQYMTAENSEGTADVSGYLTVEHAAGTVLANQRMTKETIKTKLGTTYTQRAEGSEYADTTLFGKIDGATSVDDASIEAAVNNMSYHEMVDNLNSFGWKNGGAPSIGKPQGIDIDGPSAVYKVDYPVATTLAATFNVELARKMGESLGNECLWAGISGWYGPAMDTHRSPFSGRNFEYYSEDGLLGGKIAAAQVSGAKTKGVFAYMKHMALNDQETQRSGNKTFVSEQALREIYLKPFRLCVEEGGCQGVMGGMNAIGFIANYDNYAEMTNVLRGEWGFDGYVE
ncbi:MAG: glycoside hydrolase family 3 C-terminal domain-containing protein, partial [Bacilli bacterium]